MHSRSMPRGSNAPLHCSGVKFTLRLNERNVLLLYVQSNIIIPAPSKIEMFCSGQLLIYAGINSDSLREEA